MSIEKIKSIIIIVADEYSIKRATLFGSRADGTCCEDSDIDLIMEFDGPVSLMMLSSLRNRLQELTGLNVDLIHGPIRDTDMIDIGKVVELYAA